MKSSVTEFLFHSFLVLGMLLIASPSSSDSKAVKGFIEFRSPREIFRRAVTESASASTAKREKPSVGEISSRELARYLQQMLYKLGLYRPGEEVGFQVKDKYSMNVNWNIQVGDVNYAAGLKVKSKGKKTKKTTTSTFRKADRK